MEPEYDVVDDQEEVHSVRIFPARPINDEREYADRDVQWPSAAQNLSSVSARRPLPRCPPRDTPQNKVPVVNRDIKPGRRKVKPDRRPPPVEPEEQVNICHSRRSSSPLPPSPLDVSNNLAGLAVRETCRSDRQMRNTEKADFRSHARSPQSTIDVPGMLNHQRHSLDLETHDLEIRSHQHGWGPDVITMSGLKPKKTLIKMILFLWTSLKPTARKTGMLDNVIAQTLSTPYTW
ncbi:uncharacterized protein clnk isoform X4 [Poecilia latipinna]|uniref:uncharacterized protein clnk isoform X4 n=1 Tax=Poecilia latipinna TaxID=48699 RepID=UPI00072E9BA3|nr:PREDICTED: cytokine-dependent hematopoietic cell linker isoform X4 [Poecilia latipinna]